MPERALSDTRIGFNPLVASDRLRAAVIRLCLSRVGALEPIVVGELSPPNFECKTNS
jgi:hypothetical protein